MENSSSAMERAHWYAGSRGREIVGLLGFGFDGSVYYTDRYTAVKVHDRFVPYCTERDIYRRFRQREVVAIRGHAVPALIDSEDSLWVIEMEIVDPPYILDFAKATIDAPPDFPPQVMREWLHRKSQDFGAHWPAVVAIMDELRQRYGVHLTDLNPGNIAFGM